MGKLPETGSRAMTFKGCRRGYCLAGVELQPGKMEKFHGSGPTIMRMYFIFLNCTPAVANRNYFSTFILQGDQISQS